MESSSRRGVQAIGLGASEYMGMPWTNSCKVPSSQGGRTVNSKNRQGTLLVQEVSKDPPPWLLCSHANVIPSCRQKREM